jgi:hypothetical protein
MNHYGKVGRKDWVSFIEIVVRANMQSALHAIYMDLVSDEGKKLELNKWQLGKQTDGCMYRRTYVRI